MKKDFFRHRRQQSFVAKQTGAIQALKGLNQAPTIIFQQETVNKKGASQLSAMNISRKQNIKQDVKIDGFVPKKTKYTHFPKANQFFCKQNRTKKIQRFSFQQNSKTVSPTDCHNASIAVNHNFKGVVIPQITFTYESKKTHHGLIQTQRVINNETKIRRNAWKTTPRTTGSFSQKEHQEVNFDTIMQKTAILKKIGSKSTMPSTQAFRTENPQYEELFNEFLLLFSQDNTLIEAEAKNAIQECQKLFMD